MEEILRKVKGDFQKLPYSKISQKKNRILKALTSLPGLNWQPAEQNMNIKR